MNKKYFTRKSMHMYDNTSLNVSYTEKCFGEKLYRKSNHTYYVQYLF